MDPIESVYDSEEQIPEAFRELYTERRGKWELTGVRGIKTQADVDRLQRSLESEREEHRQTKERYRPFSELGDLDDVRQKLDRFPELEALADGKVDEGEIEKLVDGRVEGRIRSKLAPLERDMKSLQQERDQLAQENDALKTERTRRTVSDAVTKALNAAKVLPEAHEDALLLAERVFEIAEDGEVITRDQVGVTPGLRPAEWLQEIQERKTHWWPGTTGGGARGGARPGVALGGPNPWSAKSWNKTEQGRFLREHGEEKAKRAAEAAGTTIHGPRPESRAATS